MTDKKMTQNTRKKRGHLPDLAPQDQETASFEESRPTCCQMMRAVFWHGRWALLIALVFLALHQLDVFHLVNRSEQPVLPTE